MASNTQKMIKQLISATKITGGRISGREVFWDMIGYFACLLSARTDPVHQAARVGHLKAIMSRYKKSEVAAIQETFIALTEAISGNVRVGSYDDILGPAFLEIGANDKSLKQDFTPPDVARLMVKLLGERTIFLPEKGFVDIADFTCGSGTLLLTAAEEFAASGINTTEQLVLFAADLSPICAQMAYLQFSLYGIPAVVVQGNSLTLQEDARWYTPVYIWNKWIWRAAMPFRPGRNESDEKLKMYDEPTYAALRMVEQLIACKETDGKEPES